MKCSNAAFSAFNFHKADGPTPSDTQVRPSQALWRTYIGAASQMDSEGLGFDQQAVFDQARVTSFRSDIFDTAYLGGAPFKSSDVEGCLCDTNSKRRLKKHEMRRVHSCAAEARTLCHAAPKHLS